MPEVLSLAPSALTHNLYEFDGKVRRKRPVPEWMQPVCF